MNSFTPLLPSDSLRISDLVIALSSALDFADIRVLDHSRRVAYISLKLGTQLGMELEEINKMVLAALLHDIGISSTSFKLEAQSKLLPEGDLLYKHCNLGYKLLKDVSSFDGIAQLVYSHHDHYSGDNPSRLSGEDIPLGSRVIHLADRVETLIDKDSYILNQREDILEQLGEYSGRIFDANLFAELELLAVKESFWLNLSTGSFKDELREWGEGTKKKIALSEIEEVAGLFASIIDMKSPFTSRHSTGVAAIAAMIAGEMGIDLQGQQALRIAGLLHDLGKQTIPDHILEKPARLTPREMNVIKQHPFQTYNLLLSVKGLRGIKDWASYHHERLDGSGYPFHLQARDLDLGCRIVIVSDVFQAMTEIRPYRQALPVASVMDILRQEAGEGKLDAEVIDALSECL